MAVTDTSGCGGSSGQSPPPLAGLDLASRGLASSAAAATASAAAALKSSSSPPEAEPKHHPHQRIRDFRASADHQGLYVGHRKTSASPPPPTACSSSNASHAEVKKLRERYFDDAAVHGLGSAERGYGIAHHHPSETHFNRHPRWFGGGQRHHHIQHHAAMHGAYPPPPPPSALLSPDSPEDRDLRSAAGPPPPPQQLPPPPPTASSTLPTGHNQFSRYYQRLHYEKGLAGSSTAGPPAAAAAAAACSNSLALLQMEPAAAAAAAAAEAAAFGPTHYQQHYAALMASYNSYHQHLQQAGASSRLAGGLRSPDDFHPVAYNHPATPSGSRRGAMTHPSPSSHWSGPFPPPPPPPPPFPPALSSLTSRTRAKSSSSSPSPPAASAIAGKDYFASPFPPPPAPPQHLATSRFSGIVNDSSFKHPSNHDRWRQRTPSGGSGKGSPSTAPPLPPTRRATSSSPKSPTVEVAPTTGECLSPILNEDDSIRQSNGKDAISGCSDGSVEERGTRYPLHFTKGSLIQLSNGDLKKVEDLCSQDFIDSAESSADVRISHSTVTYIDPNLETGSGTISFAVGKHKIKVTVEADLEHPFFVFGRGWSSASPNRTLARYNLQCNELKVGDVCISLTHRLTPMTQRGSPASSPPPPLPPQQHSIGPSSPRSGIEVARHEDEDEDEAASSTSLMPPPMPELKALKKACPNAAAEERSNLRGEVNEADDPKADDGIIPSENKHETARNRATDAAKFRNPSSAASDDRESEEICKTKRLKYDGEVEDGGRQ